MAQRATEHPQFKQGYLYVVRLLAISRKSESELERKLEEKGYLKEVIEEIFKALRAKGIVSDTKLVEETVQWGIHSKRYGKRRIFVELKKKGVAEAKIEEALKQYPETTEKEIAGELAQLRWEKLQKLTPEKRKKRLYDYLLGRGFGFELARELVTKLETHHDEKYGT